ncbi:MAG: hypothetical protein ACRC10_07700 [Thermoguttaceae bacterium]
MSQDRDRNQRAGGEDDLASNAEHRGSFHAFEEGEQAGEQTRFGIIPPHVAKHKNITQVSKTPYYSSSVPKSSSAQTSSSAHSAQKPSAADYEEQGTRFGLIPPGQLTERTTVQRGQTGSFEFDGTQALTPDVQEHRLEHHVPSSKGFFALFRANLPLFSILFVVALAALLIPLYFVPYLSENVGREVIADQQYEKEIAQQPESTKRAGGTTVRLFGQSGSGNKFLFLIDGSNRMNEGPAPSPMNLLKRELLQSLKMLTETDQFEVAFFNNGMMTASHTTGNITFLQGNLQNREIVEQFVKDYIPDGQANPEQALSKALKAQPHVLFFVCETLDVSSVSAAQWSDLAQRLDGINCVIIELGFGREPLRGTTLKSWATQTKSNYFWKNTSEVEIGSRRTQSVQQTPEETPDTSIAETVKEFLGVDFTPEHRQKMMTVSNVEYTPFGKGLPVATEETTENRRTPKQIPLSEEMIDQIAGDARLVYLSGFPSVSGLTVDVQLLKQGIATRLDDWVKGADAELPAGEFLIGLCYKNGVGIDANDFKAFQCLLKSALGGCVPSMTQLGNYYMFGAPSIKMEPEKARFWIERAARLGEPVAQTLMGSRYSQNPAEKVNWYERAAHLGYTEAIFLYARCLETGDGIEQNVDEARQWYEQAASLDHFGAKQAVRRLEQPKSEQPKSGQTESE